MCGRLDQLWNFKLSDAAWGIHVLTVVRSTECDQPKPCSLYSYSCCIFHTQTITEKKEHCHSVQNQARFQVLTAASMKMAVFWDVAPCSLVEVYRRFRGACCLHHQGDEWNVCKILPDYTAQHPRRHLQFRIIRLPVSDLKTLTLEYRIEM
jgi:hypothetical protein